MRAGGKALRITSLRPTRLPSGLGKRMRPKAGPSAAAGKPASQVACPPPRWPAPPAAAPMPDV